MKMKKIYGLYRITHSEISKDYVDVDVYVEL